MKPGSKAYLKFRIKLQQIGIFIFLIGLALVINKISIFPYFITAGATWFGLAKIMQAFEPVYNAPKWEKVFPELEDDYEPSNFEDHV